MSTNLCSFAVGKPYPYLGNVPTKRVPGILAKASLSVVAKKATKLVKMEQVAIAK